MKLECRNVWKVYGRRPDFYFDSKGYTIEPDQLAERMAAEDHIPALIDATFDVHEGEIFMVMGLSGSGKSTLIRCLSRLIGANHGQIRLDGQDLLAATPKELIEIRRHKMGMVFQSFGLLPHLTVLENTAFPLKLQGIDRTAREEKAREMINLVGWRDERSPIRISFPAGSNSVSASPAVSPSGRSCGFWTSHSQRWIR